MQKARLFPEQGLPVEQVLNKLTTALGDYGTAVLRAEPGAGKTTVVPLALLGADWLNSTDTIIMLQPRRVAARAAAQRMASLLGEKPGQRVGYRVSMETAVSADTRIEVITEGILTRMIQSNPELPGIGLIIFDEFHERSLHADLGLALSLDVRENLRPDLRILVMSATIDGKAVSTLLGPTGVPVIDCPGSLFPVQVRWKPPVPKPGSSGPDFWGKPREFLEYVAGVVREGIAATDGDILVFLPGTGEISRITSQLSDVDAEIVPLHGSMSMRDQNRALDDSEQQKVILATSVAETSVTIPGVTLVIDSGLSRYNRFDARLGMDRLVTERVSDAAAKQRQGRAGRTQQGQCWKLWPADEKLEPWLPPESERADLASFVLEAAAWGADSPPALRLLSPPSESLWNVARDLLNRLGALSDGSITQRGRSMAELAMHPRLARMVLLARDQNKEALAFACAALIGERDILIDPESADLELRLQILLGNQRNERSDFRAGTNQFQLERSRMLYQNWISTVDKSCRNPIAELDAAGEILALAWPDRVGMRKSVVQQHSGRLEAQYLLANGRLATLSGADAQHAPLWIVAIEAEAGDSTTRIRLFCRIGTEETSGTMITRLFQSEIRTETHIEWEGLRPRARYILKLDRLTIEEKTLNLAAAGEETVRTAFLARVRTEGLQTLPWSDESRATLCRIRWAAQHHQSLPDCSDAGLVATLESWLLPFLRVGSGAIIDEGSLKDAVESSISWNDRAFLNKEVPTSLQMPSGSYKKIEYAENADPVLAVRIQEIFGMASQPRILGVPLVLHLLSPAQRPLQITADLESFWKHTWPEIRKEMRGRYPRHYWPDNPLEAEATARVKPRVK